MSGASAIAIVPARYASVRFPGKPLADRTGKPLIQHVVENARRARRIERVVVATDDARIAGAVRAFGGEAVMTGEHPNGTSRLAEAAATLQLTEGMVVNVQGDEPELPPQAIDALIDGLAADPSADMATLYAPLDGEEAADPNIVKVVKTVNDHALYFSRSAVPFDRDGTRPAIYKHPGLYAYRLGFLLRYPTLAPTPLEQAEKLEQLRVLEHGHRIRLIDAGCSPRPGIDTPEQYEAFVRRYAATASR